MVERVLLAKPRGFCAGVEMAVKALEDMLRLFSPPVYCYHEIVHNRLIVERFRSKGVVFVDRVEDVPEGAPLMLSAHGCAPEVVQTAQQRAGVVVNAVCPLVAKVHHEARSRAEKGYTIFYVGHPGHDEAVGLVAVAPDAIRLVQDEHDLEAGAADVPDPTKVAVLAQTTLAVPAWTGVVEAAQAQFSEVWLASRSDLCFATTNRQKAVRALASSVDAMVVIGSANSSNTQALASVAMSAGCAHVQRVDDPSELDLEALAGARDVGVTAGASAPEDVVQAVVAAIAPTQGVEEVAVTDESEYFPPPRELRLLLRNANAAAADATPGVSTRSEP